MDEKDLNLILMQGKFLLTFQKNLIHGFDSFLGFDVFKHLQAMYTDQLGDPM